MKVNSVKKRRLSDLFVRGEDVTIDDGQGGITVHVQKLNPVEAEQALRKANAARATFMAQRKDPESEVYLSTLNDMMDMSREELLEFVVADALSKRAAAIEAEIAGEEDSEWAKDNYLQGLYDAWEGGLKFDYDEAGEKPADLSPEAEHVLKELERYTNVVSKRLDDEAKSIRADFERRSDEKLMDQMVDILTKMQADLMWMVEYRKSQIWLGTKRAEDHSLPYFDSRFEVDELHQEVTTVLVEAFSRINVEVDEGKDLPEKQDSSLPSGSPETPEMESSSSPEE